MNQYWECINVEILNQQTETDTEWGKNERQNIDEMKRKKIRLLMVDCIMNE